MNYEMESLMLGSMKIKTNVDVGTNFTEGIQFYS